MTEAIEQQESTRPVWTPVYMGEGLPDRCQHCGQTIDAHYYIHEVTLCQEVFLRLMDGNR